MARIRSTGNKDTELRLIALMRAAGITGWRRGKSLRLISRDFASRNAGEARSGPAGPPRGWRRGAKLRFADRSPRPEIRGQRSADTKSSTPSVAADRRPTLRETSPPDFTIIRPDFVFPKQRLAVFVDGCFFHGCPRHVTWPKQNAAFWKAKMEGNRARDRRQSRVLRAHGWRVLRIWEHALGAREAGRTIARLHRALCGSGPGTLLREPVT